MKRILTAAGLALGALVVVAMPAFAHVEFEPAGGHSGETVEFTLFAENEAGFAITKVELSLPDGAGVVVDDAPETDAWTVTIDGDPATTISWEGSVDGDAELPVTLTLPDEVARLQFQAIVTYANGEEDEWLTEWPEGAEEPATPGPVIDVVGADDTIPVMEEEEEGEEGHEEGEEPTATTAAETAETTAGGDETAAGTVDDEDDGSNVLPIVIGAALIVGAGALGAFLFTRKQREA